MARPKKLTWHEEVLDAAGLRSAARLAAVGRDFYLAGGTGLALRIGHRVSLDLDLFSWKNPLEEAERVSLIQALRATGPVEVLEESEGTLHLLLEETRASLLRYHYPLLGDTAAWNGLAVASPEDMAAMKVAAVVGRGSKKDFVDLYALATGMGLERLLRGAGKKYAQHRDFLLQAAKALVYFDDADKDTMPRLLRVIDWDEVKGYFEREVPRMIRRLVEGTRSGNP